MSINWFPGHMHKARKEIAEVMPQVDVIIEMLDARIPFSSENPLVPELRGDTPVIKVLNKADLANPAITDLWVAHMEKEKGIKALPLTQQEPEKIKQLLTLCHEMLPERNFELRGVRAMIMGIPNVGKSTLINTLAGRIIARTGNEAGVTKSQQRIKLDNNVILTDTPGFLWPKLNPPSCGYRLAITAAIKDTVFDYADIAMFAADYFIKAYPERIKARYQIDELPETEIRAAGDDRPPASVYAQRGAGRPAQGVRDPDQRVPLRPAWPHLAGDAGDGERRDCRSRGRSRAKSQREGRAGRGASGPRPSQVRPQASEIVILRHPELA